MSNETTTFILDYAEVHHDFSLGDLFAYLQEKTGIKKSSLSWYLFKLVNENVLVRTGRGTYAKVMKQVFSPQPIEEVKEVYGLLQSDFPFAKFCVYQGDIIAPLQHHLSSNRIIYVGNGQGLGRNRFQFSERQEPQCLPTTGQKYDIPICGYGQPCHFREKPCFGSSLARSIRRAYAHVGKTVSGYIERYGLFLPARQ